MCTIEELLWSFLCNLINISAMGGGGANQGSKRDNSRYDEFCQVLEEHDLFPQGILVLTFYTLLE
jgi:hypothetical protein